MGTQNVRPTYWVTSGSFIGVVSISMPLMNPDRCVCLWFSLPNLFYLLPIPLGRRSCSIVIWRDLHSADASIGPFS